MFMKFKHIVLAASAVLAASGAPLAVLFLVGRWYASEGMARMSAARKRPRGLGYPRPVVRRAMLVLIAPAAIGQNSLPASACAKSASRPVRA